MENKTSFVFL